MATAKPAAGSHHALITNSEYQIKLVTLLNECCDHLREILHDPTRGNMPRDKKQLYLSLKQFKKDLNHLKKNQLEIVFPQNKETDSELFDITILCDVLINCCNGIQAPIGGWRIKTPQPDDFSVGADIIRIRNERNNVMHGRALTVSQYNRLWNAIEGILQRLGYDITKIKDLKSGCLKDLELFKIEIMKAEMEILNFNVKENQDDTKHNKDEIKQNRDDVKQNQGDIKTNKDNIQQNEDGIKKNKGYIKTNKDNIKHNQINIKLNDDAIKESELNFKLLAAEVETVKQSISLSTSFGPQTSQLEETIKEQPSFMLFKNHQENLVVQFHGSWSVNCVKHSITEVAVTTWKQLTKGDDYIVEEKEGKTSLIMNNVDEDYDSDLLISLTNIEQKNQCVSIKDIALENAHKCTANNFSILTHNSGIISKQIEGIRETEIAEACVEFISSGSRQRMSSDEFEKFERDYTCRYFKINDKWMEEPLQFPPPMLNEKCSVFAQRIKNIMIKSKHRLFTIFTHYSSKEHIQFLKLGNEFSCPLERPDHNRILLCLPNTMINIRYTDTTDVFRIQDEFKAGEQDLKALSIINKKYLRDGNFTMANVVAAPNFEDNQNANLCVDCKLICKKTWNNNREVLKFFTNIIHKSAMGIRHCDDKDQYINIVSKIMCFMATRKALYSVPSLSDNIHEQVSSLILTTQQLRFLYDDEKKKIITGPLGSGKTVLALSHLELAYILSQTKSVIYYVIWDDKTLLKQDVARRAKFFNYKDNVSIVVKDIVEIAKDLNMQTVPAPSQLLPSLVEKHGDEKLHLIIDELNGEVFDMQESSLLKHYLETEKRVNDSIMVFFPQSVERHRTFISHDVITKHNKYKYRETGIKTFKLSRAMRTTKSIFNFLKAFEEKAAKVKTVFKLPPRLPTVSNQNAGSLDKEEEKSFQVPVDIDIAIAPINNEILSKGFRSDIELIFNSANEVGHSIPPPRQARQSDVAVSLPNDNFVDTPLEQPQFQAQPQLPTVSNQNAGSLEKKEEEESFQVPVDIDIIAASINDDNLSKDVRSDIELIFNSAKEIGHSIEGTKPLLLHPAIQQITKEDVIPMLAFVLEDILEVPNDDSNLYKVPIKRLFIYNTFDQMSIFYKLLKLLKINFLRYDDSTDWKILKCNDTIVQDLSQCPSYTMLTTPQGSRGVEASKCICIIDKDDTKLKHLTLEGMSRATQSLILVSTSNISESNTLKSATGNIVSKLISEYLIECCFENSDDSETEIPFTKYSSDNKVHFSLHTQSWQYEEMVENSKAIDDPKQIPKIKNANENIFKSLHRPEIVDNITCSYVSGTSCELRWRNEGYRYTVKRKERKSIDSKIVARNINSNKFIVNDMVIGKKYKFCVAAENQVGKSDDSIVSYHHKLPSITNITFEDIEKLVKTDNISELKRILTLRPNIVHVKNKFGHTPLISAARGNSLSMVEFLTEQGSHVWANGGLGQNCYHYASLNGRHTILDFLCRHDATNINRGDINNGTPLHYAAAFGKISCVDVLLRQENIDVTIKTASGETAYDVAGTWWNEQNREIIRQRINHHIAEKN